MKTLIFLSQFRKPATTFFLMDVGYLDTHVGMRFLVFKGTACIYIWHIVGRWLFVAVLIVKSVGSTI